VGRGGRERGALEFLICDLAVAVGVQRPALLEPAQESDDFPKPLGVGKPEELLELAVGLELGAELLPVDGAAAVLIHLVKERAHVRRQISDGDMLEIMLEIVTTVRPSQLNMRESTVVYLDLQSKLVGLGGVRLGGRRRRRRAWRTARGHH
jgi:hypothetical protein